jgi:RecB family endonuclease NucS
VASLGVQIDHPEGLEVLGEMAIPLGHIDLLLKQRVPLGSTFKIPIEVKTNRATPHDVSQLRAYMDELREDCQIGALVAADFAKTCARKAADAGIKLIRYTLASDLNQTPTFQEIFRGLTLYPVDN